jgi:hypothetical protein
MSFISDPTFQFTVVIIVPILSLIVVIFAYLRRFAKPSLSYKVINIIPLLDFRKEVSDKLRITYESEEVEDATVLLIHFANTGNVKVDSSDIKKPITCIFEKDVKVLKAEITEGKAKNLGINITTKDNSVTINLELLNPKESFTIKIITSKSFKLPLMMDYRIVGISKIKEITPKFTGFRVFLYVYAYTLIALFGGIYGYSSAKNNIFVWIAITGLVGLGVVGVTFVVLILAAIHGYFSERRTRRILTEKQNND